MLVNLKILMKLRIENLMKLYEILWKFSSINRQFLFMQTDKKLTSTRSTTSLKEESKEKHLLPLIIWSLLQLIKMNSSISIKYLVQLLGFSIVGAKLTKHVRIKSINY